MPFFDRLNFKGLVLARRWDAKTGALVKKLTGHNDEVLSVAPSPDGRIALTGSLDKNAYLWDVLTGALLKEPVGHRNPVISVAFNLDGTMIATCSNDSNGKL